MSAREPHLAPDSAGAVARVLALAATVDGRLGEQEAELIGRRGLADRLGVGGPEVVEALHAHLEEMALRPLAQGSVQMLPAERVDEILDAVVEPRLRRRVAAAMVRLAVADGDLAEAEVDLISRALARWGLSLDALRPPPLADAPMPRRRKARAAHA